MEATRTVIDKKFFDRPTLDVAEDMLGLYLVHEYRGKESAFKITEVEAYDGFKDKASHAYHGKTPRCEVMFGEPGTWYVYLIYGIHWMLNVVTGPEGYPAAILIRGVDQVSGPGRLTKFIHITKSLNKKPAVPKTGLWMEDRGEDIEKSKIEKTPRIGVDYAEEWAKKPYRFLLEE